MEKKMRNLLDTDPMPFGKFKGQPMQDVPTEYLHWLWSNGGKNDRAGNVAEYVRRNIHALQKENPDLIWD